MLDKIKQFLKREVVHKFNIGCAVTYEEHRVSGHYAGRDMIETETYYGRVHRRSISNNNTPEYTLKIDNRSLLIGPIDETKLRFHVDDSLKNSLADSTLI